MRHLDSSFNTEMTLRQIRRNGHYPIMTSNPIFGTIRQMWSYLQRWQVANSLYHLQRKRDNKRWVQEHDLFAYISGMNLETHVGGDTPMTTIRAHLAYLFYGVRNHDELYRAIRNIIHDCEDKNVNWIVREYDRNSISPYLNLTARGREIYPYSHLIGQFFGNYYVKWAVTGIIVWILGKHLITVNF